MLLSRIGASRASNPQGAGRSIQEIFELLDQSGFETASGARITTHKALMQSTVWACVRILSESIAQLPVELKRKRSGRIEDVDEHPALSLIRTPNDWQTPHEFWQNQIAWMELRGNGYAYKVRNGRGRVMEMLPLTEDQVSVEQDQDWRLIYTVGSEQINNTFTPEQMFHLRNFGVSSYVGLSTIGYAREAIGLALRTEEHGARLFKNGAQLGRTFEHPNQLSQDAYERLKKSLANEHGGASNAWKTLILEEGMKVSSPGMTNEDSQFLETRRFQKQDIAAVFGVPLFLLNDTEKSTTWGSGLEQITKGYVRFTLAPRLSRIEQTLNRELLLPQERGEYFFKFNTDQFSLGEFKERMEGYKIGIEGGVINPNEARSKEGMNARDGGDEYRQPMNIGSEGQAQEADDE